MCRHIERGSNKHGKVGRDIGILSTGETTVLYLIGLLTMIQIRAFPDYYRMVLMIHYGGDSEIQNYEYERDCGNNSEGSSHQIALKKKNKR